MAAPKILKLISGVISEVFTIASSSGAGDADKVVATDANGRLDPTFMPGGVPVNSSAGAGDAGKLPKLDASGALNANMMPGGAPVNTSAGATDGGKLPKLDAAGKLALTMMPTGVFPDTQNVVASEAIPANSLVNLWNNAGTLNIRKADATTAGKEANGFILAAVASGAAVDVYFDGTIPGLTGLSPGQTLFLSTIAGQPTGTAPSASGNIVQGVGKALSTTTMTFEPSDPITLA